MKTLKLDETQVNLLRKQILIILADYRDMVDPSVGSPSKNPLANESTRVDISERILSNLLLIGGSKR